jgi:hypothetical protein
MTYVAVGLTAAATTGIILLGGASIAGAIPGFTVFHRLLTRKHDIGIARKRILDIARSKLRQDISDDSQVFVRLIPSADEPHWAISFYLDGRRHIFRGREALHIAHLVAPAINENGGTPANVRTAVKEIEDAGSAEKYFLRARDFVGSPGHKYSDLRGFPSHLRLAFEMAAHEESERAAMAGELAQLESDWREAEEIASIADNMFVPRAVSDFIQRHREKA